MLPKAWCSSYVASLCIQEESIHRFQFQEFGLNITFVGQ